MAITAAQVKELREMTGAGRSMDCKKAYSYRWRYGQSRISCVKKGLATAQKSKAVLQQKVCKTLVADDEKNAVVVEVNSETDFVAKNEKI